MENILKISPVQQILSYLGDALICIVKGGTNGKFLKEFHTENSDIDLIFIINDTSDNLSKIKTLKQTYRDNGYNLLYKNQKVDFVFLNYTNLIDGSTFMRKLGSLENLFLEEEDIILKNTKYEKAINKILHLHTLFPTLKEALLLELYREIFHMAGKYDNLIRVNSLSKIPAFRLRIDKILESKTIYEEFFKVVDLKTRELKLADYHFWKRFPIILYLLSDNDSDKEFLKSLYLENFNKNKIEENDVVYLKNILKNIEIKLEDCNYDRHILITNAKNYIRGVYEENS